jgi:hypothetical protein
MAMLFHLPHTAECEPQLQLISTIFWSQGVDENEEIISGPKPGVATIERRVMYVSANLSVKSFNLSLRLSHPLISSLNFICRQVNSQITVFISELIGIPVLFSVGIQVTCEGVIET